MDKPKIAPGLFAELDRRRIGWVYTAPGSFFVPAGEVAELTTTFGLTVSDLFDQAGAYLAVRYQSGALSYELCDQAVNYLFQLLIHERIQYKDTLFDRVYSAFDNGEYQHAPDKSDDPESDYTRPQIEAIVHDYSLPDE